MTLNELLKVVDDNTRIQIRLKMFGSTFSTNRYKNYLLNDEKEAIVYRHDKATLKESKIIYKNGIDGFFLSVDGGETWKSGFDSNGDAVLNILYAIGIQAEYINTRGLTAKDNDGNITFRINADTGEVKFNGNINRIDWNRNEIIIYGEKGKKERKVYLTDECAYHLRKYLLSRNDTNPALFVSSKQPHTRLGKQAIQSMLRTLGQKTDIHAHPHKFRRTLLTDAGNRGIPLQEIQHYAGHEKPDTTMMYVTVSEENVRASFRRYIA